MLLPALAGCVATMPERVQLETSGRYDQLVQHEESVAASGKTASAEQLFNLCSAYARSKRYQKLFACADELERKIRTGDVEIFLQSTRAGFLATSRLLADAKQQGIGRSNGEPYPHILKAEALIDLGNYAQAIAESEKAVSLCEKVQTTLFGIERFECFISSLGLAGLANALNRNVAQAEQYVATIRAYPLGGSRMLTSPRKDLALARILAALGAHAEALGHLDDGWSAARALEKMAWGAVAKDDNIFAYIELPYFYLRGKSLLELGRIGEAKEIFDQLLSYPQVGENGQIYAWLLFGRGRVAEMESRPEEAIGYYRRAVEIIESQRSTINTEASKIGFVGDKQGIYAALTRLLLAKGDLAAAFEFVERAKSRALVDMLAEKQDFTLRSGDAARVGELLARSSQAEAALTIQDSGPSRAVRHAAVREAKQQLHEASPELASLVGVSTLSVREVQSLIPPGETLIEYYQHGDELIAFVVTSDELKAVRLDGSALAQSVRQFRDQLDMPGSDGYLPISGKLYDRLVRPLAGQLKSGKLIIVAHGPLHYLPFNALHDGHGYLIDRYSLRFLPSASVMKYIRARPVAKPGDLLVLGNPDLGNPSLDLANAQAEALAIAKGRGRSKVLLRKEASEAAFRRYGDSFRYIHLATHGEFNPEEPLKSALLLAKDAGSDGLLTAAKLYAMKLDADLVTLSACETGIGRISGGDDVVGLSRGFLYAGSRSIVASLWKVDDQATAFLMTSFYEHLQRGDKREALRQAQRETMKRYPHPFFWAAFQITGSAL